MRSSDFVMEALLMGAAQLKPQNVFNTSLFPSNNLAQTITTGLNMTGNGGLVWLKARSGAFNHSLFDTQRGATKDLSSNSTAQEITTAGQSFTASGYIAPPYGAGVDYVGWSFRRAPKFFDIVTYTGNGVAGRQIPHSLGVVPGMIVVKARSDVDNWWVYHRSLTNSQGLRLNDTSSVSSIGTALWNSSDPTASNFTLGSVAAVNGAGITYVAYLFAQNPDLIDCGSYTGNGSTTGPIVTCGSGWRPQWLMVKNATVGARGWLLFDSARDSTNPVTISLSPHNANPDSDFAGESYNLQTNGFQVAGNSAAINEAGQTFIYTAIREAY